MSARIVPVISLLAILVLWSGFSFYMQDSEVLPAPWELIDPFVQELSNGALLTHLSVTCYRVLVAFVFAMLLGGMIGFTMGYWPRVNRLLDPWLVVFLNLPALVLIVLCYLWIGLTEMAAIIAVVLNKIPNVATVIREGARALDPQLSDLARVYKLSKQRYTMHVLLPQLAPFIAASARAGVAVIWKIVLVVEFLGRSSGIGFQIHLYFQLFDVAMVLVYALSFIAIMLLVEWMVLQPWEQRTRAWRHA